MGDTILCNLSDANQVISEARELWVQEVLLGLGVKEETLKLAKSNIQEYRYQVEEMGIEVDFKNGEVDVYKKKWHNDPNPELCGWLPSEKVHLVAQWKEPNKFRKVEGKDVYYEIHLNNWSMLNSRL
jgi:hypothetical protein